MKQKVLIMLACLVLFASFTVAQTESKQDKKTMNEKSVDYSSDHESIDSIIKATYDVISGPKGEKRDWDRFAALFHPDARLIPSGKGQDGTTRAKASSPAEYRKGSEPFFDKNGFFEKEIGRTTETFGNLAHVFSAYEGKTNLEDEIPLVRGINSFQLLHDGKRWWVMTIFWLPETKENLLPQKYLGNEK